MPTETKPQDVTKPVDNAPVSVEPAEIKFGKGKYSTYMLNMYSLFLFILGRSKAQAFHFASALGSSLGELQLNVTGSGDVKYSKPNASNQCAVKESSSTAKGAVVNSPAIELARLIVDLDSIRSNRRGPEGIVILGGVLDKKTGEKLPAFPYLTLTSRLEKWLEKAKPVDEKTCPLADNKS